MGPINYLPQNSDFGASLIESLQLGGAVRQMRQQREQERLAEQYRTDLSGALKSNDPNEIVKLTIKYPQQGAGLQKAWDMLSEEQRKAEMSAAQQGWYALNSGRPDVALSMLDEQITGMKNSGKDPAKLVGLRAAIERDPASAAQNLGLFIATVAPKDFAETVSKLGKERREQDKQPGELEAQSLDNKTKRALLPKIDAETREANAKADSAAVAARFAESNAVKDLEKKGWDIKKIQKDIEVAEYNKKIAMLNVKIGQEGNAIKRGELQLRRDEFAQKRDESMRAKTSEVESARSSIDNFLNTADRILVHPGRESATGSIAGRTPSFRQDSADFDALVENLGAQAFLSQVPAMKGMGALSDAEGKKLGAALQSLDLKQSPQQFATNVKEAQRLILKARNALAQKYGVPNSTPDTPAAASATPAADIDALVRKYAP